MAGMHRSLHTVLSLPILESDWKINFAVDNHKSKEIIFPVVFSTADGEIT